ncbi:hypothetical protein ACFQVC_09540 [Streptomyces monticola]|uniref:Uncharacterized protein n=1 Tax=Streptomyces monticola TaxID=2666263 RepID=A0ABW2JF64_9ACTN
MDQIRAKDEDCDIAPRMRLRIYTVNREGAVTSDTGVRGFDGCDEDIAITSPRKYPPCACMWCRNARASR